jgi:hypothetical protein
MGICGVAVGLCDCFMNGIALFSDCSSTRAFSVQGSKKPISAERVMHIKYAVLKVRE